ncbi:ABC transporter substrate-binding protein [Jiangella asiatica]|uniref:ABC transporter substrate-binding protein n=1 Tax=Jiangella asiatica TaxID=2530372 RepID=A0A4R5DHN2_9ACTN|nr:ABC transporter substrate-binding protein [Jiangella asiatica]TDE11430.1 ABC transporter substrate-binding protein [Jiangella asiatica]
MRNRIVYAITVTAAGLAALTSCAGSTPGDGAGDGSGDSEAGDRGPITVASRPDTTGVFQHLADRWNEENPTEQVELIEQPQSSDETRAQIVQNMQARSSEFDLIMTNNVWVSEFAARDWIEEIPEESLPDAELLEAPLDTARYEDTLYALPLYTDAGLLYYRSDLVPEPPGTFGELMEYCDIAEAEDMGCYAGQFAKYDGLTVNVQEAINAAGGDILDDSGAPAVDTPEAAAGLQLLQDAFEEGWISREAITYAEEEGRTAFQQGRLLFLRNWPYMHKLASTAGDGNVVAGKFDVAPLPGIDGPGTSALGGWNMAVSTYGEHKDTARDFAVWLLEPEAQRSLLADGSLSPVVAELYDDPELVEQFPYLPALKEALANARPLPKSPAWSAISLAVQDASYAVLQGETDPADAVRDLQAALIDAIENM